MPNRNLQAAVQAFSICMNKSGNLSIEQELAEVQELRMKNLSQRIGLSDLQIMEECTSECGPGCVVWECGVFLSWYLVNSMAPCIAGRNGRACHKPRVYDYPKTCNFHRL